MAPGDRQQLILDSLERDGRVLVSELSALAGVSEMTIRRDLEALEHAGGLSRVHGGAVPAQSRSYEPPFAARAQRNLDAKRRIGRAAAALLHEGETAILDAGTPALTVMVAGGIARRGERSLIGSLAERTFADLSFDTFFLTVGGIDVAGGLTEYNLDDAAIKRAAFAGARRRVAVADASKLAKVAFARICSIDELDVLVTDADAPAALLDDIRRAGVEVVVA